MCFRGWPDEIIALGLLQMLQVYFLSERGLISPGCGKTTLGTNAWLIALIISFCGTGTPGGSGLHTKHRDAGPTFGVWHLVHE